MTCMRTRFGCFSASKPAEILFMVAHGCFVRTTNISIILSCRSTDPLELLRLPFSGNLFFVLVNPKFEAPTAKMRAALPKEVGAIPPDRVACRHQAPLIVLPCTYLNICTLYMDSLLGNLCSGCRSSFPSALDAQLLLLCWPCLCGDAHAVQYLTVFFKSMAFPLFCDAFRLSGSGSGSDFLKLY